MGCHSTRYLGAWVGGVLSSAVLSCTREKFSGVHFSRNIIQYKNSCNKLCPWLGFITALDWKPYNIWVIKPIYYYIIKPIINWKMKGETQFYMMLCGLLNKRRQLWLFVFFFLEQDGSLFSQSSLVFWLTEHRGRHERENRNNESFYQLCHSARKHK